MWPIATFVFITQPFEIKSYLIYLLLNLIFSYCAENSKWDSEKLVSTGQNAKKLNYPRRPELKVISMDCSPLPSLHGAPKRISLRLIVSGISKTSLIFSSITCHPPLTCSVSICTIYRYWKLPKLNLSQGMFVSFATRLVFWRNGLQPLLMILLF